jgi:hypothetical protein
MGIQSNLTSQSKRVPPDHREPDFYIDPNCCTLHDAAQQLTIDSQADTPFIIWLLEHPNSSISLPGKIDLYGHDCLHVILNRGHSPPDEAFILGFTMGNDLKTTWLHQFLYKFAASIVYPKKYRFSWKDFQFFDAGFVYGRSIPRKNLNQLDFSAYQNHTVSQVRQQLAIFKASEIELLQSFSSPRQNFSNQWS